MIGWNNLRILLDNKGEKAKLSMKTGISTGNISDWLNPNRTSQPSADALNKIADYYDCSVDYLLDRTDIKNTQNSNQFLFYHKRPPLDLVKRLLTIITLSHQKLNGSHKNRFQMELTMVNH